MSKLSPPRRAPAPTAFGLLMLPGLVVALGLAIVWVAQLDNGPLAAYSIVNIGLCLVGVFFSFVNGFRPVAMAFYVFVLAWLGIAPVYQLTTGILVWGDRVDNHSSEHIQFALTLTTLFVVFFSTGYAFAFSSRGRSRSTIVRRAYLGVLLVVTVALAVVAVARAGGPAVMFSSRSQRLENVLSDGLAEGGVNAALTRVAPVAFAVAFALLAIHALRCAGGWREAPLRNRAMLLLAIGIAILVANPFSNSRFIGAVAWGSIALALCMPRSQRAGAWIAVLGLVGVLVFYPLANAFRSADGEARTGVDAFSSGDFDGFQQIVNTIALVEGQGHSGGRYLISAVGFFVPRSLWPAKAQPAAFEVSQSAGYWFNNLSLPFHAEIYLEFGLIGVIIASVALGAIARRSDDAWIRADGSRWFVVAPLLAISMLGIMRGPVGSLIPIYGTAIVVLLLGVKSVQEATGRMPYLTARSGSRQYDPSSLSASAGENLRRPPAG